MDSGVRQPIKQAISSVLKEKKQWEKKPHFNIVKEQLNAQMYLLFAL